MRDFRKLEIWQLGMEIWKRIYLLTQSLPDEERYGLQRQMRKAAVSMPSNIAEGCSRTSNKERKRFLEIAIGSAFELETQIIGAQMIGYLQEIDTTDIISTIQVFQRRTHAYSQTLGD